MDEDRLDGFLWKVRIRVIVGIRKGIGMFAEGLELYECLLAWEDCGLERLLGRESHLGKGWSLGFLVSKVYCLGRRES